MNGITNRATRRLAQKLGLSQTELAFVQHLGWLQSNQRRAPAALGRVKQLREKLKRDAKGGAL
jgi:hypothetical protein